MIVAMRAAHGAQGSRLARLAGPGASPGAQAGQSAGAAVMGGPGWVAGIGCGKEPAKL